MTDPDQLDREATEAEQEALAEAAQAQALAATGDPNNQVEAKALDNEAFYLTMTARKKHKDAQKIRTQAESLDAQIAEKQKAVEDMTNERVSLGDPSALEGAAARSESRAAECERQITALSLREDDYSVSQAEKLKEEFQEHTQRATDTRKEAQDIAVQQASIDKEVLRLNDEIKDLENKKNNL